MFRHIHHIQASSVVTESHHWETRYTHNVSWQCMFCLSSGNRNVCVRCLEFVIPWGSCWEKLLWLTIDYTCCNLLNKLSLCNRSLKVYLKGQGESWIVYLWHLLLLWLVVTSVLIWSVYGVWRPLKWPLLLVGRKSCLVSAAKKVPRHVTAHVDAADQSCRVWLEETRTVEPLRQLCQQQPVVM